jgi:hypothetical protein
MKKILQRFRDIFHPRELQMLDSLELLAALNDPMTRKIWLYETYEELKRLNLSIDAHLTAGMEFKFTDLCARRKAYQDILESILSAKRQAKSHNPDSTKFDLEYATA